ncbi:MAG: hypothetical protein ACT4PX_01690, partial [Actinomycetota bacterium]
MTDQPVVGRPPSAPDPATGPPPRWGLGDAAVGFGVAFFLSLLFGSVYVTVTGQDEVTLGLTLVSLVGQWTGLAGAVLVTSRWKGTGDLRADFGFVVEG